MAHGNGVLVATGGSALVVDDANTSAVAILLPAASDDTGTPYTLPVPGKEAPWPA